MPAPKTPSATGLTLADVTATVMTFVDDDNITTDNTYWQTFPWSTTIASGSNGAALPQAIVHVASTTGAPTSGSFWLTALGAQVSYTGIVGNTFVGCTGGTGTMATGQVVTPGNPNLTLFRLACLLVVVSGNLVTLAGLFANVAYLNIAQSWTALQTFNAGMGATNGNFEPATGAQAITVVGGATAGAGGLVGVQQNGTDAAMSVAQYGAGDCLDVAAGADLGKAINVTKGLVAFTGTQPAAADTVPANSFGAPQVAKAWGTFSVNTSTGAIVVLDSHNIVNPPVLATGRGAVANTAISISFKTILADQGSGNNDFSVTYSVRAGTALGVLETPFTISQSKAEFNMGASSNGGTGADTAFTGAGFGTLVFSFQVFGRQ